MRSRCRCSTTDGDSALALHAVTPALRAEGIDGSAAMKRSARAAPLWATRLPEQTEALWDWLLAQDADTLTELLAYCVSCTVKPMREPCADQLAAAVALDMAQWWQPTVARLSRARLQDAHLRGRHRSQGQGGGGQHRHAQERRHGRTRRRIAQRHRLASRHAPRRIAARHDDTGSGLVPGPVIARAAETAPGSGRARLSVVPAAVRRGRSENCGLLPAPPPPCQLARHFAWSQRRRFSFAHPCRGIKIRRFCARLTATKH